MSGNGVTPPASSTLGQPVLAIDGSAADSPTVTAAASAQVDLDEQRPMGACHPWRVAALFVVPYLILMLSWVLANPPGAAPDEPDHLIKAIGMATFDIGDEYAPVEPESGLLRQRNASISRVIPVPGNLSPGGFACMAFKSTMPAACQYGTTATSTAPVTWVDPLGSYPPFLYVPLGWVASLAPTPTAAFLMVRVFCALLCSVLLLLGAAHLVRTLGSRALLGGFVALTPMAVYSSSVVSASGLEICAAFATTCVVVVALRRPDTLRDSGTALLLAGVGGTLILSRQLGVVTFGLLMLLLLIRLRPAFFWKLLLARKPGVLAAIGLLVACGAALAWWERNFDHPSMVGSPFNPSAVGAFAEQSYGLVRSGVGLFGWVDTPMPPWFTGLWVTLMLVLIGLAVLVSRLADRWTLLTWLALLCLVAFFTYATVFYPIGSHAQGRHLLAFFMLLPMLSGGGRLRAARRTGSRHLAPAVLHGRCRRPGPAVRRVVPELPPLCGRDEGTGMVSVRRPMAAVAGLGPLVGFRSRRRHAAGALYPPTTRGRAGPFPWRRARACGTVRRWRSSCPRTTKRTVSPR